MAYTVRIVKGMGTGIRTGKRTYLVGACGAIYRRRSHAKAQRSKGRKGKRKEEEEEGRETGEERETDCAF